MIVLGAARCGVGRHLLRERTLVPSGSGADAKRIRRRTQIYANSLQELPIVVFRVFKDLAIAGEKFRPWANDRTYCQSYYNLCSASRAPWLERAVVLRLYQTC